MVVIKSPDLLQARVKAAVHGFDRGLAFESGHPLDPGRVRQIPANIMGRLLDGGDLRKLHPRRHLSASSFEEPHSQSAGRVSSSSVRAMLCNPFSETNDRHLSR